MELLAIVEVAHERRVACQASGCGRAVYKQIHVVRTADGLLVLGSDCFAEMFGGSVRKPRYGSSSGGEALSEEDRQKLVENTQEFIASLVREHQVAEARQRALLAASAPAIPGCAPTRPQPSGKRLSLLERLAASQPTEEEMVRYGDQARRELANEFHINTALPGWRHELHRRVLRLARGI